MRSDKVRLNGLRIKQKTFGSNFNGSGEIKGRKLSTGDG